MELHNSKKGYTLAELIIVSAIVVLIIGAASVVLILGGKLYKSGSELSTSMSQSSIVEKWLQNSLSVSSNNGITQMSAESTMTLNQTQIYFQGDVLHINGTTSDNASEPSTNITLDSIDLVQLNFAVGSDTSRVTATYTIESKTGRTMTGSVVMNNTMALTDISPAGADSSAPSVTRIELRPQTGDTVNGIVIQKAS